MYEKISFSLYNYPCNTRISCHAQLSVLLTTNRLSRKKSMLMCWCKTRPEIPILSSQLPLLLTSPRFKCCPSLWCQRQLRIAMSWHNPISGSRNKWCILHNDFLWTMQKHTKIKKISRHPAALPSLILRAEIDNWLVMAMNYVQLGLDKHDISKCFSELEEYIWTGFFLKPDLLAKELKSDQSEKCTRYAVKNMKFAMTAF